MGKIYYLTGITGQAGYYYIEMLLNRGDKVFGLIRRTSNLSTDRIKPFLDKIELLSGDLEDEYSLITTLEKAQPDCVINLGSQSLVPYSFEAPISTASITGLGVLRLLSAIKKVNPKIKFLQASSSEQFGLVKDKKALNEQSRFCPRSPYAIAKVFGYYTTINYRESYDMFCANAICFNYESEFRNHSFVTKKVCNGIKKILNGEIKSISLGNLEAVRDWSHASDTVAGMDLIVSHFIPDDFVISSGECHTVREFTDLCFKHVGLNYMDYIKIDPSLFRPAEVPFLLGDSTKIKETLGYKPKVSFQELIHRMMKFELQQ